MSAKSSKGSARGTLVSSAQQSDLQHWSELERKAGTILLADSTIRELFCQFPTVEWVDVDGVIHEHRFDFFAIYHDGTKRAFNVKCRCDEAEVTVVFDALEGFDLGFEPIWVNEDMATDGAAANARLILTARQNENEEDYMDALLSLEGIHGGVFFHSLLNDARNVADRREALHKLIDRGVIVIANELERLADYTKVLINRPLLAQELHQHARSVA